MANYEYLGCVTGFSEARNTQLIQPTDTPMPVTRASNAYTERLLGVGLLVVDNAGGSSGAGGGSFLPLGWTPTATTFLPKVVLPSGKDRVILRYALEVDGELLGGPDYDNNQSDDYADTRINRANIDFYTESHGLDCNTAEFIAEYLMLDYMGVAPMAQDAFQFTPQRDLSAGETLVINGVTLAELESLNDDAGYDVVPAAVKLTFKIIDNLPADAVDFTQETWGHEVSIYSCAKLEMNNTNPV